MFAFHDKNAVAVLSIIYKFKRSQRSFNNWLFDGINKTAVMGKPIFFAGLKNGCLCNFSLIT
jgi:hypothetical protein